MFSLVIYRRSKGWKRGTLVLCTAVVGMGSVVAALEVETNPGMTVAPGGTINISCNNLPGFSNCILQFPGGEFGVSLEEVWFHRGTADPSVVARGTHGSIEFSVNGELQKGAEVGIDNWMYVCHEEDGALAYNGWVQLDITASTVTPVLYVHDPASPTTLITLPEAVAATMSSPREIQVKSVDFENGIIELHNFGSSDQALDGWRFCTHDEDESLKYSGSSGLNGMTIEAGTSLFIHFNNDAPVVNADTINRSSTGGSWATPLDAGAYGLGLYFQTPFGVGANLADHVQWSLGGLDDGTADERSDEAQSGGVWTDQTQWVATSGATTKLVLTDGSAGELHGPADYLVLPDFGITSIVRNAPDGVTLSWPAVNNLTVTVEKSTTLTAAGWSTVDTTSGASSILTGQTDSDAFYRLNFPLP